MRLDLFDYDLPADRIALHPADPPEAAWLLAAGADGAFEDFRIADLPALLRAGDLMVVNDTRVIPALIRGVRPARAAGGTDVPVELMLHQRLGPATWRGFARPAKRLRAGDLVLGPTGLTAEVLARGEGGEVDLSFALAGEALDAALETAGAPPLPPYILDRRPPHPADRARYQTVYAQVNGSVAAPTAGLHLTEALLARLAAAGVERTAVTLHVGAGTFLPVKTEDVRAHRMHSESFTVPEAAAQAVNTARREGRRVVAIGTTALRALESAMGADGQVAPTTGDTSLFIAPGYRFRAVDGLLTNFHLPRSTLLMLLAAFAGLERMRAGYTHAIAARYRFYSFGDASLWWRAA